MLLEGQQLDQYRFVRLLKSGGMGEVYLADDEHLHRQVAIKIIRADTSRYPDTDEAKEAARLFVREAQAIAQLDHIHILPVYGSGEKRVNGASFMYMVMPFRHEGSFTDWLRKRGNARLLSPWDVEIVVKQAASALQHAHDRQVIHQDIKPSNFLIYGDAEHPGQLNLQLADFGVAKFMTTTNESQNIRGTPAYMAPEQWEGHPVPATDQYALAVMAYELLTGRPPFVGTNHQQMWHQHFHVQPQPPSAINATIPRELDTVLIRALAKNPTDRFGSVSAFAHAFQQALLKSGNIHQTLNISALEAQIGTQRILTFPGGRQVTVSVPAGAYHGQIIRLEGQGIPSIYGGPAGALILTIAITHLEEVATLADSATIEQTAPALNVGNRATFFPPRQSGFRRRVTLLISLALVLIAGSLSLFYVIGTHQQAISATATADANGTHAAYIGTIVANGNTVTAQVSATRVAQAQATTIAGLTATAQAQATATTIAGLTATAHAQATATAIASMTATAPPQPTATAIPSMTATALPSAPVGKLIYADPLNNATNSNTVAEGWDDGGQCTFMLDGYHVTTSSGILGIGSETLHACRESNIMYGNVDITVDVSIHSGHTGGLLFRVSTNLFNAYTGGYLFEIDSTGDYRISRFNSSPQPLDNWTPSPALKTGNATNTLWVDAKGGKLGFYANGKLLIEIPDTTYISGYIAFLATTNDTASADVVYSHLKVYQLS